MEEAKIALHVNDKDNVATIFANGITDGTEVEIRNKRGECTPVTVIGDVPYGHKIAVRDIKKASSSSSTAKRSALPPTTFAGASTYTFTTWTPCGAGATCKEGFSNG